MHPVRQLAHAPGVFRVGFEQVDRRFSVEDATRHYVRPKLDLDRVGLAHVERAVLMVLEEHRAQAACHDVGRGFAGVIRVSAAVPIKNVDQLGDDRLAAPDAVFLDKDRDKLALLIEVRELGAAAEDGLVFGGVDRQQNSIERRRLATRQI